jgi:hypothetical protein
LLKEALQTGFNDSLQVFVSSDKVSISSGQPWYNTITSSLLSAKIVIVLLSQESCRRPWINFEAGMGVGRQVTVIPLTVGTFSATQVPFPISGLQIHSADDLGIVLRDVSAGLGRRPFKVDIDAYTVQLREVESRLVYKSLLVTPSVVDGGRSLVFDIENQGNADFELLMLEMMIPRAATEQHWSPTGIDSDTRNEAGLQHWWLACYSPRGVLLGQVPYLRRVITPGMGKFQPRFSIPLASGFPGQLTQPVLVRYALHAVGYSTGTQEFELVQFRHSKTASSPD